MNAPVAARTELAQFFETNKAQIANALPKHLSADRMCRLAMTAFSQNSSLRKCDLNSIFASVVIASQLGLEIGVAGQGYLVPYKGRCTFVPGWQGLVDLVSRSGRATVWTGAVHEGDDFDWALGDRPFIKHKPRGRGRESVPTHTYSVGRAKGSEWPVIEVWENDSILAHRDKYNKVGEDHYSFKNWEMYARKVPLLQVIKYLPKSIELANALALEGAYAEGKTAVLEGDFVRVDEDAPDDSAASGPQGPQAKADAGNAGSGTGNESGDEGAPLSDGAKTTLSRALEKAGRTEKDLIAAGFKPLAELRFTQFQKAMDWAKANPAATSK